MQRMSSEEDQEVFEITDFTTASDWERFIARIEEVFHEWKLPQRTSAPPLKKGELSEGTWIEKREQLMFASFQFEAVHHQLKPSSTDYDSTVALEENDESEPLPFCLADMMSKENDFPPKAHCLVRWYGLREFIVIHPAKTNDAIMTEDRTKMLLSSVYIAVNNTSCQIPVFVQLQQMRQKYFLGVCEGGGVRTSFDMVHLHRAFNQYSHLSGLLSLFKSKLASSSFDVPPVSVSIRFTYILQDWSPCSWPQPPPEIDELGEDITPTDIGRLPSGAIEDPILEFHLSVTWPHLFEDAIVDNDVHSDLNPVLSPKWSMRMRTAEKPSCSMAEYLKEFVSLSLGYYSENQLLGNVPPDEDETGGQNITQALDKLAHPNHPVPLPSLSAILPQPRLRRQSEYHENTLISEEVLIKILQYIFPDSAPTPAEPDCDEWKDSVNFMSDLHANSAFSKIQEHMRSFKSAPVDSLTWRLALAMCQVNHSYGGLPAVAQLWQDFLLEMRHRWENNYTLPCLDPGTPNMNYCLLHQKLQMLNCCIQRKKSREWQQLRSSVDSLREDSRSLSSTGEAAPSHMSESDDEEFFECAENSSSSSADSRNSKKKVSEGRLRQLGETRLLYHDEPLYIPLTQEPAPVTEDMLEEQAEVLVQLGTHAEGAALRARMQSACLMSDMEAFKAANPKSALEDFVRWYSPRDLIEEEVVDQETGKKTTKYSLSQRMLLPGNMWLEAWESARPVPARRQKRLFDDTKEAEKVLHFLASAKTSDVVTNLLPMLIHCALLQLAEEEECPQSLPLKLEETAMKAAKVMRSPVPKYEAVLRCLYQAEVIVAQIHSVSTKFGLVLNVEELIEQEGKLTSSLQDNEKLSEQQEIRKFVLELLDNYEIDVPGAGKGVVGRRIRHLFSEAQRASHLIMDDKPLGAPTIPTETHSHHSKVPEFPASSGKEFILRTTMPRPPGCTPTPQRMYCVITREEFRVAGAFTEDTTFL
ncbi:rab3 GTPase-activating protein catalytic subunit [Parasteatoda tepidariorum]|uniref:rab3 GTPase-activating protein catalytic subunit n=1 Tax=Parasteatoda tepidariorum TaxID=114398 RepID=UPI00077FCDA6|nr:rab3 GTPase-activating protein catalytic subunit [Parasteatoda tepidariorum]